MSRWPNKYVIGLTGNIAVGKSVVRQMLQHLGAYTIDADGLSHQAMSPGAPAYKPVVENFGQFVLNPDKTINRTLLGRMVFGNPDAMKKLEAITHPVIGAAINTLVGRAKQRVVVIEAIKLLEGNLKDTVDEVWVVHAEPKTQYIRLVGKRKMSEDDAKQRILAQGKQGAKLKQADLVIKNEGNIEDTWKQVQAGWNTVTDKLKAQQQPDKTAAKTVAARPDELAKAVEESKQAKAAADEAAAAAPVGADGVTIKRGMPGNAETIAGFIKNATGKDIDRMDVIMSFGQKSYLLADNSGGATVGLVGWQVENLITRVDELYIKDNAQQEPVIYAMVKAIEDASRELQSEVSFIFLPPGTTDTTVEYFVKSGYELTTVKDIKIPAWREAVQEVFVDDMKILTKKLRKDRVLKPI